MCSGIAKNGNIYNEYHYIRSNVNFCNKIRKKMLLPKNVKFTSKFYWKNSPLKSYLQNTDLCEFWILLNNNNENNNNQIITS